MKKLWMILPILGVCACGGGNGAQEYVVSEPAAVIQSLSLECTDWFVYADIYDNDTIYMTAESNYRDAKSTLDLNAFNAHLMPTDSGMAAAYPVDDYAGTATVDRTGTPRQNAVTLSFEYHDGIDAEPIPVLTITNNDAAGKVHQYRFICHPLFP